MDTPTMTVVIAIVIFVVIGAIIFYSVYDTLNPFKENTEQTTDTVGDKIETVTPTTYVANIPTISGSNTNSESQELFNPTAPPVVDPDEIPSDL